MFAAVLNIGCLISTCEDNARNETRIELVPTLAKSLYQADMVYQQKKRGGHENPMGTTSDTGELVTPGPSVYEEKTPVAYNKGNKHFFSSSEGQHLLRDEDSMVSDCVPNPSARAVGGQWTLEAWSTLPNNKLDLCPMCSLPVQYMDLSAKPERSSIILYQSSGESYRTLATLTEEEYLSRATDSHLPKSANVDDTQQANATTVCDVIRPWQTALEDFVSGLCDPREERQDEGTKEYHHHDWNLPPYCANCRAYIVHEQQQRDVQITLDNLSSWMAATDSGEEGRPGTGRITVILDHATGGDSTKGRPERRSETSGEPLQWAQLIKDTSGPLTRSRTNDQQSEAVSHASLSRSPMRETLLSRSRRYQRMLQEERDAEPPEQVGVSVGERSDVSTPWEIVQVESPETLRKVEATTHPEAFAANVMEPGAQLNTPKSFSSSPKKLWQIEDFSAKKSSAERKNSLSLQEPIGSSIMAGIRQEKDDTEQRFANNSSIERQHSVSFQQPVYSPFARSVDVSNGPRHVEYDMQGHSADVTSSERQKSPSFHQPIFSPLGSSVKHLDESNESEVVVWQPLIEQCSTMEEEMMIIGHYEEKRAIATKAIGRKLMEGYALTQDQCNHCQMPLMERDGFTECVVCPIVSKKAKKRADQKRYDIVNSPRHEGIDSGYDKERLSQISPPTSPRTESDVNMRLTADAVLALDNYRSNYRSNVREAIGDFYDSKLLVQHRSSYPSKVQQALVLKRGDWTSDYASSTATAVVGQAEDLILETSYSYHETFSVDEAKLKGGMKEHQGTLPMAERDQCIARSTMASPSLASSVGRASGSWHLECAASVCPEEAEQDLEEDNPSIENERTEIGQHEEKMQEQSFQRKASFELMSEDVSKSRKQEKVPSLRPEQVSDKVAPEKPKIPKVGVQFDIVEQTQEGTNEELDCHSRKIDAASSAGLRSNFDRLEGTTHERSSTRHSVESIHEAVSAPQQQETLPSRADLPLHNMTNDDPTSKTSVAGSDNDPEPSASKSANHEKYSHTHNPAKPNYDM